MCVSTPAVVSGVWPAELQSRSPRDAVGRAFGTCLSRRSAPRPVNMHDAGEAAPHASDNRAPHRAPNTIVRRAQNMHLSGSAGLNRCIQTSDVRVRDRARAFAGFRRRSRHKKNEGAAFCERLQEAARPRTPIATRPTPTRI